MADKIIARFGADLTGRCFALWGLAFKPNTDDMREAPSLTLIDALLARGATVAAYDPVGATKLPACWLAALASALPTHAERADGADALAIVTEWKEFRAARTLLTQSPACAPGHFLTAATCTTRPAARSRAEYHAIGRPERIA